MVSHLYLFLDETETPRLSTRKNKDGESYLLIADEHDQYFDPFTANFYV